MNIEKGCEKNKYLSWKLTESRRLMRGAREHEREYLLELHTEIRTYARVDCDGIPNVILGKVSEIFSRTC